MDADYPVWWRHPNGRDDAAEIFLDLQARAESHPFLELGDMALSPDEAWLAWTEDTRGDETFALFLKRLPDGEAVKLLEEIGAHMGRG